MIPCIVCPVLNRPDLLQRMISSIDHPVGTLVVVNNSNGKESLHEMKVPATVSNWDEKVCENLGVAGSWNYGLNYAFNVKKLEYVIIVGSDIQWSPGDLKKFEEAYTADPSVDFMSGNWSFSTFAITRKGFGRLGWFDENILYAYLEDSDYWYRCQLTPDFKAVSVPTQAIHGEAPSWGSMTIHSDPEMARIVHDAHNRNWDYYIRKWGGKREGNTEVYKHPFNDPSMKTWDWKMEEWKKAYPHFRQNG